MDLYLEQLNTLEEIHELNHMYMELIHGFKIAETTFTLEDAQIIQEGFIEKSNDIIKKMIKALRDFIKKLVKSFKSFFGSVESKSLDKNGKVIGIDQVFKQLKLQESNSKSKPFVIKTRVKLKEIQHEDQLLNKTNNVVDSVNELVNTVNDDIKKIIVAEQVQLVHLLSDKYTGNGDEVLHTILEKLHNLMKIEESNIPKNIVELTKTIDKYCNVQMTESVDTEFTMKEITMLYNARTLMKNKQKDISKRCDTIIDSVNKIDNVIESARGSFSVEKIKYCKDIISSLSPVVTSSLPVALRNYSRTISVFDAIILAYENHMKKYDSVNETFIMEDIEDMIGEMYLSEEDISSIKRSDLEDKSFGIPSERKYPMHDKKHVLSAIKLFGHVDSKHEKELADNIKKKMKEYNISDNEVGDKNKLKKYLKEEAIDPLLSILNM